MKSTYLGRSCRSLPAARRRRGAGSITSHTLKDRSVRQPSKLFTSGLKLHMHGSRARVKFAEAEERRGRVRERLVPSRKTGRVHINAGTLYSHVWGLRN